MKAAGLEATAVTVGACHVELAATPARSREDQTDPEEAAAKQRETIYRQFGGPVFEHVQSDIPPGELQPAIGRTR